uniref:ARAD1C36190p n=1 Tax=Blastobotrys adeninivorans TaxID=409370 RepID=A0A060T994_BLAAD
MAEIDIEADDFGLRDEDFAPSSTGVAALDNKNDNTAMEVEEAGAQQVSAEGPKDTTDSSGLYTDFELPGLPRLEAVHLKGVDEMSTKNVNDYVTHYVPDHPFSIEWVNDESVNLVFDSEASAQHALNNLTSEAVYYETDSIANDQIRQAKVYADQPSTKLRVRIAFDSDKKAKRAANQSRYYQKHGRPTFESERYRFYNPDAQNRRNAENFQFRQADSTDDAEDLFPSKAPSTKQSALGGDNDLFPEKVGRRSDVRLSDRLSSRDRSPPRSRNRSPSRRQRSRSPQSRGSNLADRINRDARSGSEDRWIKGDLLSSKRRRGRRKAADLF